MSSLKSIGKAFVNLWCERMDKKKIRRISAAFGSYLILLLGAFTTPILQWVTGTPIDWKGFVMVAWIGFTMFASVFVISLFGTTGELEKEEELAKTPTAPK